MVKGLYIHIPFCNIKCPYCDFTSITINNEEIYKKYIETLKKELLFYKNENINFETIYFGGGTPSILNPKYIIDIINFIKKNFKIVKNPEITVEVNPKTYRFEDFSILKEFGINRVSIGVQSFLVKNLKMLGRNHTPEDCLKTVEDCLKAGIENINLDLIFGIQNQTLEDLEEDLKIYTSLDIKHISAYMLTPYEETPLGQLVKNGYFNLPSDEEIEDMYKLIIDYLKSKNFYHYELSNWAKEGYQCKHNLFYWENVQFLGVGVSAWSYINNVRFGSTKNLFDYIEKVNSGVKPILFKEFLTEKDLKNEKIMLGLRLTKGIDKNLIQDKENLIKLLQNENLLEDKKNRVRLTPKGFLLSNYIISKLLD
ncbi:MAG: coproporphyrinogen III oxidase family protein [Persephonella sp.]|nr:MAG: coproporphyrinogen III oxidase family protein [Persephonella sp.]